MRLYDTAKDFYWLLLVLVLAFIVLITPARADYPSLSIRVDFGYDQFGVSSYKEFDSVPLGKTFHLAIHIDNNGPNAIRLGSLTCSQQGNALSASSISRLPNTVVIAPNTYFVTEQLYRTIAPGMSEITCAISGVDTVTKASLSATTAATAKLYVSGETRLYFNVSSATHDTTRAGQRFTIMAVYGNRGPTTLTNVMVTCSGNNHGFSTWLNRQTQTMLPPGQSGFAEFIAVGELAGGGALISCSITADDPSTGTRIALSATPLPFATVP